MPESPIACFRHSSARQQSCAIFPRRDVLSINLGFQEHISSLPIPLPLEKSKYPASTTAQQLPIILSNQWSFLVLRQQEEQQASQVTKVQPSLGKAHTSIISLIVSAPLWLSLYPHVTGRERLFCSAKIIVGELTEKGEGWWDFMELEFPPGPRPLSLPLPFYLTPKVPLGCTVRYLRSQPFLCSPGHKQTRHLF